MPGRGLPACPPLDSPAGPSTANAHGATLPPHRDFWYQACPTPPQGTAGRRHASSHPSQGRWGLCGDTPALTHLQPRLAQQRISIPPRIRDRWHPCQGDWVRALPVTLASPPPSLLCSSPIRGGRNSTSRVISFSQAGVHTAGLRPQEPWGRGGEEVLRWTHSGKATLPPGAPLGMQGLAYRPGNSPQGRGPGRGSARPSAPCPLFQSLAGSP